MSVRHVHPVHPEQRGEFNRRGFYHPTAIIILALITLSFAVIFFINSEYFQPKKSPSPTPVATAQLTPSPSVLEYPSTDITNWRRFTDSNVGISFKYPEDYYYVRKDEIVSTNNVVVPMTFIYPKEGFNHLVGAEINAFKTGPGSADVPKGLFNDKGTFDPDESVFETISINGNSAARYDDPYTGTTDVYILRDKKFFSIKFYSRLDSVEKNKEVIRQILSTFQFLN